jgi:hypothetical protein
LRTVQQVRQTTSLPPSCLLFWLWQAFCNVIFVRYLQLNELFLAKVINFSMAGRRARALAKVVLILPFSINEEARLAINEIR